MRRALQPRRHALYAGLQGLDEADDPHAEEAICPRLEALGVWVEVTTVVIPGVNDSDEELGAELDAWALVAVDDVVNHIAVRV